MVPLFGLTEITGETPVTVTETAEDVDPLLSGYFSEESRNVLRISMMLRFFPGTI
jgi:hypothetical protein